ncbi:hypothetical protein ACSQ67_011567 [Phaseolus vulgaris]
MLMLFQHGTWLCYFTMELASTFAPPRNRLSAKRSASFSSFFVAMVCGGGSWLRLRLWFMLRASSYTFFSSIRDSWFILKVVVRSVWQWFMIDFGLAKKYRDSSTHQHIPYRYEDLLVAMTHPMSMASEPVLQGERWILATGVPFSSEYEYMIS